MQVARLKINNFRGIQSADILLTKHSVLLGDNNTGKTTILEALDLALGPDRLSRGTVIDEHDFFLGKYLPDAPNEEVVAEPMAEVQVAPHDALAALDPIDLLDPPKIVVTVTVIDLSVDQLARFGDYIEFWSLDSKILYQEPAPEGVDGASIRPAIRVTFEGEYDKEEDDFTGNTYFTRSMHPGANRVTFSKKDKQFCGFLYLRGRRRKRIIKYVKLLGLLPTPYKQ